ncbi:TPA: hypothetical protein EYP26_03300 [Candidatus Bathyarchaeota archaeon]|nr:hypothetical protein [Candidatus Bathyarchaeota archaeon]
MKIALLSRWNTACGVSLHAELVGREWVKMGHKLTVFAPNNIRPVGEDEEYVLRCYSDEGDHTRTFFNPEPFLKEDYEIFVAQRLEWAPIGHLKQIFTKIREKAKTVYVVHERKPPADPQFYEFGWDAVVCFDARYKRQWSRIREFEDKIRVIPYPTGYLKRGDKARARRELGLPAEEKIIFSYGWAPELHVLPVLPYLKELREIVPFTYLIVVDPEARKEIPNYGFVKLRRERPSMDKLYAYLHASDVCLAHKQGSEVRGGEVVVSSSVLMCMGALTPIVTSDTEFVSFLDGEVIKYRSPAELKGILAGTLKGRIDVKTTLRAAEDYAREHSPKRIARAFLELFEGLLRK